jgi:hypothetical protein
MENQFDEVMATRTDAELIKILNSPEGDYQPAAFEAATKQYTKRNLSIEQITVAEQEIEEQQQKDELKANEGLSSNMKYFAVLFPMLLFFAISGI